jgi:TIR domain
MSGPPAAFMSYARFNDKHDEGQLSQFRERLAAEVQVQTGEEFAIFQDRNDIAWGENWRQRIDGALDTVTFLLAVITPGFFRSSACRGEVERFLIRESELGRQDLILPVYYVSVPR